MGEGKGETFAFLPLGLADALVMRKQTTIKEQKERNIEIRSNDSEDRNRMWRGLRAMLGTPAEEVQMCGIQLSGDGRCLL